MCSQDDTYSMTFQNSIGVPIKITEKVILDLIKTKEVQRLKHIKQAGITAYSKVYRGKHIQDRFEHSVHVMLLVRHLRCNVLEQIRALLHDVGHTPFSHIGDLLYGKNFHEVRIYDYLRGSQVEMVLKKHGYSLDDACFESNVVKAPRPDINADRLTYCLDTCLIFDKLTIEDARNIYDNIKLNENSVICFTDKHIAVRALKQFMILAKSWVSEYNTGLYYKFTKLIEKSFQDKVFSKFGFLYLKDDDVVACLRDKYPLEMKKLFETKFVYQYSESEGRYQVNNKIRFLDPLITRLYSNIRGDSWLTMRSSQLFDWLQPQIDTLRSKYTQYYIEEIEEED